MEFTEATTPGELSLSALEGLNLTGQRVKLSTEANAPEKALNSSSQATSGFTFFPGKEDEHTVHSLVKSAPPLSL